VIGIVRAVGADAALARLEFAIAVLLAWSIDTSAAEGDASLRGRIVLAQRLVV
jgi:hypothetical protein